MSKAKVIVQPGTPFIEIEREFDAPREKLYAAMTDKAKLEQWWTGPGYTCKVTHLEARSGGGWAFVHADKDGNEFSFHGTYHLMSPEMSIQTFEFDGLGEPGHVALERSVMTELEGGRTRLNVTSVYLSVADRDGMIASGMEAGMQETYDNLERVARAS